MFIDIHELEHHPIDFREELRPDVIDFGPDVRQRSALKASGRADLVEEHQGKHKKIQDIRIKGGLATRLEVGCARCLEPVGQQVVRDFELLYRPQGTDARSEELSVTDAEAEISYYIGDGINLEDVLREQVLLALPLKTLCRDDCKGLCPHCGANWNNENCCCSDEVEDPRWSALKEIRKKLEP